MKKISIFFLLFGVFILTHEAHSQTRMTEEEKEEAIERYLEFQDKLNLTEEQQPQVEEINMTFFEGLSRLRNSDAGKLEKYRTFKDLSKTRDQQMKQVLDEEQFKVYKEFQAENRENFKERRRKGNG